MIVLGLTGGFHYGSCDASASLVVNGKTVASVEEERLSRVKNSFGIPPTRCIKSVLEIANVAIHEIDFVALYVNEYPAAEKEMYEHIESLFGYCPKIQLINHHLCHAASSYYSSGWDEATVVTFDWSGDGVSSSIWLGKNGALEKIESVLKPNSLGIFYAALTQFLGFERGDEYKVMGLAAYGKPVVNLDQVLDISEEIYNLDSSILNSHNRNMHQLVISQKLKHLYPDFWRPRFKKLEKIHMDFAASVQHQFEIAVFNFVNYAVKKTSVKKLCIAGGGALNCTANGKILSKTNAEYVFVPPFPNDTGCSYGAAAIVTSNNGIKLTPISTAQLGPTFTNEEIGRDLDLLKCKATYIKNVADFTAAEICNGKLIGWFQGGLEVGPRALGGRSILADPRDSNVKEKINKFVKYREDFRPFAPSVLESEANIYFDINHPSPFMNFIAPVKTPKILPGITHIDGTARVQTVNENQGVYFELLLAMKKISGHPVVLNTSFNYMGQPIVCNPKEAIYTFYGTGLDVLVMGNWVVKKNND